MTNEVIKKDVSIQSKLDLIKRTVAKGATNDEFAMFMHLAKNYQLDPISKEIWFIKYDDRKAPTIMTSRDGYLAIANRNKHYDGMLSDVVHENDEFEKLPEGTIKHKYHCKDRGNIIGAYALGYRDDRKFPIYVFAQLSEYNKNNNVWRQYTSAMILKVAEAMMLKRLFSISGLVTREEIDEEYTMSDKDVVESKTEKTVKEPLGNTDFATQPQVTLIKKQIVGSHLFNPKLYIKDKSILDLLEGGMTKSKASEIISWWKGDKDKLVIGERTKREAKDREEQAKPDLKATKADRMKVAKGIIKEHGSVEVKNEDEPFPGEPTKKELADVVKAVDEKDKPGSSYDNAIPFKGKKKELSKAENFVNEEDIPF